MKELFADMQLLVDQVRHSTRTPMVTCLLEGTTGSGKTALAATIAKNADFPFVKFISPKDLVGFNENMKASRVTKIFGDAHKSTLSIIVIDDIERLLDYNPIGPRFSNIMAQTGNIMGRGR